MSYLGDHLYIEVLNKSTNIIVIVIHIRFLLEISILYIHIKKNDMNNLLINHYLYYIVQTNIRILNNISRSLRPLINAGIFQAKIYFSYLKL